MDMNLTRFSVPVLDEDTQDLYEKLYGDVGKRFIAVLNISPDEVAVISRMIAFLKEKKGA